jgi:hypothetical protein
MTSAIRYVAQFPNDGIGIAFVIRIAADVLNPHYIKWSDYHIGTEPEIDTGTCGRLALRGSHFADALFFRHWLLSLSDN